MAYQIVKGWPSAGSLDEKLTPAAGQTIVAGNVIMLDSSGNAVKAELSAATHKTCYLVIDTDPFTGAITALTGPFIVEMDTTDLVSGSYAVNDVLTCLTANAGKLVEATLDGSTGAPSAQIVAKVLKVDATAGKVRLIWLGA
jgi:hypothetical protein